MVAQTKRPSVNGVLSEGRIIVVTHNLPWTCSTTTGVKSALRANGTRPQPAVKFSEIPSRTTSEASLDGAEDACTVNGCCSGAGDTVPGGSWKFQERRGHSAIYAGIRSLKSHQVVHIGSAGQAFDDECYPLDANSFTPDLRRALEVELWESKKCVPVFLDEKKAAGHYEGYCKTGAFTDSFYVQLL